MEALRFTLQSNHKLCANKRYFNNTTSPSHLSPLSLSLSSNMNDVAAADRVNMNATVNQLLDSMIRNEPAYEFLELQMPEHADIFDSAFGTFAAQSFSNSAK